MIAGFVGTVAMFATVLATFYAISFGVLYLAGRALPLAGRRRRR